MSDTVLIKQYILDANGAPIGVILPIDQYELLTQSQGASRQERQKPAISPLFGALRSSAEEVAPTLDIDEALDQLWSAWDKSDSE